MTYVRRGSDATALTDGEMMVILFRLSIGLTALVSLVASLNLLGGVANAFMAVPTVSGISLLEANTLADTTFKAALLFMILAVLQICSVTQRQFAPYKGHLVTTGILLLFTAAGAVLVSVAAVTAAKSGAATTSTGSSFIGVVFLLGSLAASVYTMVVSALAVTKSF